MDVWQQLESFKENGGKNNNVKKEKIIQLKEGLQVQKELLVDLKKKEKELEKKRSEAVKLVPKEWLCKYERMKHMVSDPIVPVISESCSACYYAVLRQDMYKLKKSGVLLCRNCYRFLYYDQEEENESNEEQF